MFKTRGLAVLAAVTAVGLLIGCEGDGTDDNSDGGGSTSGSFAGTWTGHVCGRGLTLTLTQDGTTLSGNYVFTNPTFSEPVNGTVSGKKPPATATLTALDHRKFDLTFSSYNALSGGFYNPGLVCNVDATK